MSDQPEGLLPVWEGHPVELPIEVDQKINGERPDIAPAILPVADLSSEPNVDNSEKYLTPLQRARLHAHRVKAEEQDEHEND